MTGTPHRIGKFEITDLDELFMLRKLLWDQVPVAEHQEEILDVLAGPESQQVFVAEAQDG